MNPLVIQFKVAKRVAQMVFEHIDTLEYAVVKGLFAQIVPEMFKGIKLISLYTTRRLRKR